MERRFERVHRISTILHHVTSEYQLTVFTCVLNSITAHTHAMHITATWRTSDKRLRKWQGHTGNQVEESIFARVTARSPRPTYPNVSSRAFSLHPSANHRLVAPRLLPSLAEHALPQSERHFTQRASRHRPHRRYRQGSEAEETL
ncbi:hypothetical protein BIW11_07729, partial [Tropilaelaps mercedesae]